jgi:hypothetical protein
MSTKRYNLYGRASRSPVYPSWVLLGQWDTQPELHSLKDRMGTHYDEFMSEDKEMPTDD